MNKGIFPIRTISPIGQPVKWLIICESPLTPPLANLAGIRKTRSEIACKVDPRRMSK
jgi:hypothetical protein